jgi:hypothetical protein
VSTLGSCACYMMSWLIGKALSHAVWPEQLQAFAKEVRLLLTSAVPILLPLCVSYTSQVTCCMMSWLIGKAAAHAIWPERIH